MKEKFTTTLSTEHKKRLGILTAYYDKHGKNELLELLIDEKWRCYLDEMENQKRDSKN